MLRWVLIMGLSVATGTLNTSTAAAGNTVSVTGLSFNPSANNSFLIFVHGGRTATGQAEGDHKFGMGYAVSTTDRGGCTSQSDHSPTTMVSDNQVFSDACFKLLTTAGAVDGAMDFDAWLSDGFRLIIDDAFAANYLVHYILVSGSDLTNVASVSHDVNGAPGDVDNTGVGFQPDAAFVFGSGTSALGTTETWSNFSFGVCDTALTNYVLAGVSEDNLPTSATCSHCRSGVSFAQLGTDTVDTRGSITAWLSNGFTFNQAEVLGGATLRLRVLCVKGGRWKAGDILSQTGTSNTGETGVGWAPVGLIFGSHCKSQSASDTTNAHDERSVGFAVSGAENCVSIIDKDAAGTADIGVSQQTTDFYVNQSTAATIVQEGAGGLVSLDSDGFTFAMSDADPSQNFIWYMAIAANAVAAKAMPPFHRSQRFIRR